MIAALEEAREGAGEMGLSAEGISSEIARGEAAVGPAMAMAQREDELPLPLPYLPSVGALFLLLAAIGSHVLLGLGKRWSVRFHAW